VPEIVQDGVNVLLVAPGRADELAQAVARVLKEPGLASRLGAAGQAYARENFGLARMISTVSRHVEEVANRR